MSPFSSKSVRRKKVKITVTFVRRSKIAERSKHREAMRSRDLLSIKIAKRSKHRESSKHREQRSKHRESSKHREHREAMRSKIAKRCYRSIAKRCYRRSRSDRSIAKRCSRGIADDDAPGGKERSPPRASSPSACRCPPRSFSTHPPPSPIFIRNLWYTYPPRSRNCRIWVKSLKKYSYIAGIFFVFDLF